MAVEQKGSLGKRETRSAEGVQTVDDGLLLRGDIEPVDGRSEHDHVGVLEQLNHAGHIVLLHASALVLEAVLAPQATGDLFAGNAHDFDRVATLACSLSKRVDHGVSIGALARTTTQYNDVHRAPLSRCRKSATRCFFITKADGAIQSHACHFFAQTK